jgi:3'-5' exoribonuclease
MADRAWIRDLKPGTDVEETYVVRSRDIRQRRGGGQFLFGSLGDRTGEVAALVWENVDAVADILAPGQVVRIRGQVQKYNSRLQIVVRRAEAVAPGDVDDECFVRASSVDVEQLWSEFMAFIDGMADPHLKQLLFRIFADEEVVRSFKVAPAARSMHHAFRSGLLEHTVSVAKIGQMLARHYGLNESLVIAGILLHDFGKIWELEAEASIEYTDDGRLIGHISMQAMYVDRIIAEMPSFPHEHRRQLIHILLAHHGKYEYGSPRRPKTLEAMLVHLVDTMDSRMAGMQEAIDAGADSDLAWSDFSRMLERHVYRRKLED